MLHQIMCSERAQIQVHLEVALGILSMIFCMLSI